MRSQTLSSTRMKNSTRTITLTLKGSVNVTYRNEGEDVYARALEFDLVGIGKDRKSALKELQEIFTDYVEEVLNTKGKVRFFNLSDQEEWDNPEKDVFYAAFKLEMKGDMTVLLPKVCSIQDLQPVRPSVKSVQFKRYCYS